MKKRGIIALIIFSALFLLSNASAEGKNCTDIKKYDWFIEVDIKDNQTSQCTIKYDNTEGKIEVKEDMALTGNPGACLERANNNYWLRIKSNCLDNEFTISCDKDFITAIVYRETASGPVYISSEAHFGSPGTPTKESIEAECSSTPKPTPTEPKPIFCTSAGYDCLNRNECLNEGGSIYDKYECEEGFVCCSSASLPPQTCDEIDGNLCNSDQACAGEIAYTLDGECCLGRCEDVDEPVLADNVCEEENKGTCKAACGDSEEEIFESCSEPSQICCAEKGGSYLLWIIILLILIGALILGIVYKNKLQVWFYSRRQGRGMPPRTGGPPPGISPAPMSARYQPSRGPAPRITRGTRSVADKEMEETMRKLKDMSK